MLRSGQRVGIELFCQITNKIIYQKCGYLVEPVVKTFYFW